MPVTHSQDEARPPSGLAWSARLVWRRLGACHPILLCGGLLVAFLAFHIPIPFTDKAYDAHRVAISLVMALLLMGGYPRPARWILIVVTFLTAWGLAALVQSPRPVEGLAVLMTHLALLLVGWRTFASARTNPSLATRSWQAVAVVAAVVYAVRTGAAIVAGMHADQVLLREVFFGFANVRHFAQLTPLLLPVIASAAWPADGQVHRAWRQAAWAALVAWWMLVWLNGSSGAFYAIWIGLAITVAIAGWRRTGWLVKTTGIAFVAALAIIYLLDAITPLLRGVLESTAPGLSGRSWLWPHALSLINAQPWLGYGPGQFAYLVPTGPGHPHNLVLSFALDYGLIGLALVGLLFWRWFSPLRLAREVRALPEVQACWPVALIAAAFGGLAHATVSGVTVMPLSQLVLAVTLGLLAGSRRASPVPASGGGMVIRAGSTVVAIVLVASIAFSLPSSCGYEKADAACRYSPAFWGQYPSGAGEPLYDEGTR
ncbi:O-antigen ligase family protein [Spectribacter hydrogenoxidans]|uniref:O-antigen ligase family protein n=1 Tax=Spectribacter hydrogenoxidans TaxID=3075608 RepID=A0ABU3BYB4_9GAMM|nr:O-antigen ligase family protein [Salinisphaera sp. W335]MDT0634278.1 O-antigen ligase family protein [Salinisphaera sp. W335]